MWVMPPFSCVEVLNKLNLSTKDEIRVCQSLSRSCVLCGFIVTCDLSGFTLDYSNQRE